MLKLKSYVVALLMCGCAVSGRAIADETSPAETPKPPTVDSVEFTAGNGDTFAAKVAGPTEMSMDSLIALAYCRIQRERTARGYDGWLPKAVQREYAMKATVQSLTVNGLMYKGERPDGKPHSIKDFCAETEAKPQPDASKP